MDTDIFSESLVDSLHNFNEKFVREALEAWDEYGCGCFQLFVEVYVLGRWKMMVMLN